uniref:Glutaredoxin domain-containing protein n=1 Tax=Neospora caninum (strain Liverpool) TaxID=572307 RepID=A0A0F7U7N1_NEOCL|nr:TPA: hypothetical protein BN1204_005275 [Neospora caninum Liverpool]
MAPVDEPRASGDTTPDGVKIHLTCDSSGEQEAVGGSREKKHAGSKAPVPVHRVGEHQGDTEVVLLLSSLSAVPLPAFASRRAFHLLLCKNVDFFAVDVNADVGLDVPDSRLVAGWRRRGLVPTQRHSFPPSPCVPQIFVDGVALGDHEALQDLEDCEQLNGILVGRLCPRCLDLRPSSRPGLERGTSVFPSRHASPPYAPRRSDPCRTCGAVYVRLMTDEMMETPRDFTEAEPHAPLGVQMPMGGRAEKRFPRQTLPGVKARPNLERKASKKKGRQRKIAAAEAVPRSYAFARCCTGEALERYEASKVSPSLPFLPFLRRATSSSASTNSLALLRFAPPSPSLSSLRSSSLSPCALAPARSLSSIRLEVPFEAAEAPAFQVGDAGEGPGKGSRPKPPAGEPCQAKKAESEDKTTARIPRKLAPLQMLSRFVRVSSAAETGVGKGRAEGQRAQNGGARRHGQDRDQSGDAQRCRETENRRKGEEQRDAERDENRDAEREERTDNEDCVPENEGEGKERLLVAPASLKQPVSPFSVAFLPAETFAQSPFSDKTKEAGPCFLPCSATYRGFSERPSSTENSHPSDPSLSFAFSLSSPLLDHRFSFSSPLRSVSPSRSEASSPDCFPAVALSPQGG